jgi:hypothetical protein
MGGKGGGILGPPLGKQDSDEQGISRDKPGTMAYGQGKIDIIPFASGQKAAELRPECALRCVSR